MSKVKGSNSIFLLYARSIFRLKWHWFNFLFPILTSLILTLILVFSTFSEDKMTEALKGIVEICLSFNGAVLGFVIAAFAIFASIGDRGLIVFSISNKRDGDYYSFHKTKLITFFKSFFWLFIACIFCFLYILILIFNKNVEIAGFKFEITNFILINFILFYVQFKVFIEIKVLIFTIYNSSLTQAKYMAQADGLKPIDESND